MRLPELASAGFISTLVRDRTMIRMIGRQANPEAISVRWASRGELRYGTASMRSSAADVIDWSGCYAVLFA